MSRKEKVYKPVLAGKKIPVLTLDNKWHRLFTQTETNAMIESLEKQLNELLRRQGKLNTESKDIKRIKNRLINEIVSNMDSAENAEEEEAVKKTEDNKRLINECNDKLDVYQDELLDIPKKIDAVNYDLMLETMEVCYDKIQRNTKEIEEVGDWIKKIRVELKKKIIRKQEKEAENQELYSYMHDIFGADVIEIFDMKYNPGEQKKKKG